VSTEGSAALCRTGCRRCGILLWSIGDGWCRAGEGGRQGRNVQPVNRQAGGRAACWTSRQRAARRRRAAAEGG
jgi:hypothetical protein